MPTSTAWPNTSAAVRPIRDCPPIASMNSTPYMVSLMRPFGEKPTGFSCLPVDMYLAWRIT